MQQVKILRDDENDKFVFTNPITKSKAVYNDLESLVEKEFRQFFIKQENCERFKRQIVNFIKRNFVKDNLCTFNFPGNLRTGERDNNIKLPDSYTMYRD